MPRKCNAPTPKKIFRRGSWEIFWNWNYKRYFFFPGFADKDDEPIVEGIRRQVSVCLASPEPAFPDSMTKAPGVVRYLEHRYGVKNDSLYAAGEWLLDYEPHLMQEVVPTWGRPSMAMLRQLDAFTKGMIESVTPDQAQRFLDSLLRKGLSPARRNRALNMCNRFFKWAVRTRRAKENPFNGIKLMKEARANDILYCTKAERDWLIKTAKASGRSDWRAIPAAFYAGCRREELFRIDWKDIDFEMRQITIPITKTKRLRRIPINGKLMEILLAVPEKERFGPVAPSPQREAGFSSRGHSLIELLRRKAKKEGEPLPEKKIGWNVFRHTFGSHLAQEGVTLDKITAWMGNTPEVCRRHYAQFVPTDRHDDDIDKL